LSAGRVASSPRSRHRSRFNSERDNAWQIAGGIGYTADWGSVFATWRYLDYSFKSGNKLDDFSLNGPMVGVTFRW